MFFREPPRFFDIFRGEDLSRKVRFHNVLQPGDFRMVKKTAPRAHVGVNEARVRRVLPPMRELVAVGVEDRVETKGLDSDLLICSPRRLSKGTAYHHSWSSVKAT
jgi:hypothetical protein